MVKCFQTFLDVVIFFFQAEDGILDTSVTGVQMCALPIFVLWTDRDGANPAIDLRNLLNDLDLLGARIGVEYDTHGLTAYNGRRVDEQLQTFGQIADADRKSVV